jgi:tetratricopeptide (TPR) repeat protein
LHIPRLVRVLRGAPCFVSIAVSCLFSVACGGLAVPRVALDHDRAGAAHLVAGRLDEAEARLRLALEYSPDFAEAHANLGLVALARGHLREAERSLRTAVALDADLAIAWSDLGVVHERLGDEDPARLDEARRDYEAALAIEPGQTGARRNLGLLLARLGRFAEARAHLLRLLELTPDDAEAAGVLAWCELRLDRPQAAMTRADAALEVDPDAASPRLVRGVARAQRGDLEGAAADLSRAAERGALGDEARLRLATVEALRGRTAEAASLVRSLLRRGEHDAAVRYVAAIVALAEDDGAAARRHAEAALRLRPTLDEARVLLARVCELEGDAACVAAARGPGDAPARRAALAPSP